MSILKAMYSGVSGMAAEGQALGVVGDNVANTNTVGFKQSRAIFEDVLGGAVGTHGAIGAGTRMVRAQQIFAQGTLLNTGEATDLALMGDGFFVVNGTVDGARGNFYTRAGQLTLDKSGTLVTPQGLAIQGYARQADGTFGAALGPVVLPDEALPPRQTAEMTITANLDASATPPALAWDPQNPGATSNFSTSMTVYDSLGAPHSVDVYFRNTGPGAWEYHAVAEGGDVVGGVGGQNAEFATGTLSFTTGGVLAAPGTGSGTVSFNGAAANQAIALDFGGLTQFGSPSNVSSQSQDGYASGALSGVKVDGDGVVSGIYTNGQAVPVAQLAIAKFRSNDGLSRAGHNVWAASRDSGEPSLGPAGSGGRAAVVAGALEQSNVDIASQFVDLIAHQRAFQANSKTITTADEMLLELVNLKR